MSFASRSMPPERDLPEPDPPSQVERLAAERSRLLAQLRPLVRSSRQERIRRRIVELTRLILQHERT